MLLPQEPQLAEQVLVDGAAGHQRQHLAGHPKDLHQVGIVSRGAAGLMLQMEALLPATSWLATPDLCTRLHDSNVAAVAQQEMRPCCLAA